YMVSNMSLTNVRRSSSKFCTGTVGLWSTGSPAMTMGWIATSSSCQKGCVASRGLAGTRCRGDHESAWSNMIELYGGGVSHRDTSHRNTSHRKATTGNCEEPDGRCGVDNRIACRIVGPAAPGFRPRSAELGRLFGRGSCRRSGDVDRA